MVEVYKECSQVCRCTPYTFHKLTLLWAQSLKPQDNKSEDNDNDSEFDTIDILDPLGPYHLVFRVKFYPPNPSEVRENITR